MSTFWCVLGVLWLSAFISTFVAVIRYVNWEYEEAVKPLRKLEEKYACKNKSNT